MRLIIGLQNKIQHSLSNGLRSIHSLDISWCDQKTITNNAIYYLFGIHTLNISGCNQHIITNISTEFLSSITELIGVYNLLKTRSKKRKIDIL